MARFETEGLDELVEDMKKMGELIGPIADKMLAAGAEVVKDAWRAEAEARGFKDTTDMINSIDYARTPSKAGDIRSVDIYPQGIGRTGVRNAEKAFILYWGTTRKGVSKRRSKNKKFPGPGIPRTLWVDAADERASDAAMDAMLEIWDDYLKEK